MKIAIIGVGGVGGYFGGKLAMHYANNKDVDVTFIARGKHLKEIQNNGLKVITQQGTFIAKPDKAIDNPVSGSIFDLIIFCVKSYDLEDSAKLFKNCVNEQTVAITVLNGVNNTERLKRVLLDAQILNGCVYISAFVKEPGIVCQAGGTCKFFFGSDTEKKNYIKIEQVLKDAGIAAEYRKDIKEIVWEKYLFVSPLASATSFYQKTFGEIMEDEQCKNLLQGLLKETEGVAKFQKVNLPKDIFQKSLDKIALFPYDTKSSLQMDFEKKKNTELDIFAGYIVNFAKEHELDVPVHEKVYNVLSGKAK
ncbi:MAG: 2-dehydropantoate 2-reductase [Deltaproteobacteria bacterium]|nr:2-dehydropantoate 2-reductase [Deltaproteobacteria bacterium]MBW2680426.1 2-dehydropantoate 2-reductase [Deltaproteobacteria bacterium]